VKSLISTSGDPLEYFSQDPKRVVRIENPSRDSGPVKIYDFLDQAAHYTATFGLQWKKYRDVQIDRLNGTRGSYNHLQTSTQGDLSIFAGATCLEIGSGAGRFTDYLVDLCETVITIEPSQALTVNAALGAPNLVAAHADLFHIPIRREKIDVVFCRGVTQHTSDTKAAIRRLFDYVRPGGAVLFDVYPLRWYTPFVTKYWLRPFLRHIKPPRFMELAERWVPKLLRIKTKYVNRSLPDNLFGRNLANQIIPIADFTQSKSVMTDEQRVLWSILDTVDMYTPRYDSPLTFRSILKTLNDVGARGVKANKSSFCFKAIAP
jgi:2-polyprenyl-3-methyl-5-hydroxy-6-metoxy-1,4-benzoquinol methylase